jgi:signal transduction histidine kinase
MLPSPAPLPPPAAPPPRRGPWLAYAGLCLLCWMLYGMAGAEWQRGGWRLWEAAYEATWNLWAPMLLGALAYPWVQWLQRRPRPAGLRALLHAAAALAFGAAWQALDFGASWWFFGREHAQALLEQRLLWRAVWGVFVYGALVLGFGGVLHARQAQASALAAAHAEAARVRAELAAISGKLNPHFLFNTLNSLAALMRKDPAAAEQALLRFAGMMRYVLDTRRGAAPRVALGDEIDFLRDYLALESLRLGPRLAVEWDLDPATLDDEIPPLTLQPLVENSIVHGIAPHVGGGTVRIQSQRLPQQAGLVLRVSDNGAGCAWPPGDTSPPAAGPRPGGVGLSALRRRFELDYGGRARLEVHTAPGAGFRVEILIPQGDDAPRPTPQTPLPATP